MKGTDWAKTYGTRLTPEAIKALIDSGQLESNAVNWIVGQDQITLYTILRSNALYNGNGDDAAYYEEVLTDLLVNSDLPPEKIMEYIDQIETDKQRFLEKLEEEEEQADAKRKQKAPDAPGPWGAPKGPAGP